MSDIPTDQPNIPFGKVCPCNDGTSNVEGLKSVKWLYNKHVTKKKTSAKGNANKCYCGTNEPAEIHNLLLVYTCEETHFRACEREETAPVFDKYAWKIVRHCPDLQRLALDLVPSAASRQENATDHVWPSPKEVVIPWYPGDVWLRHPLLINVKWLFLGTPLDEEPCIDGVYFTDHILHHCSRYPNLTHLALGRSYADRNNDFVTLPRQLLLEMPNLQILAIFLESSDDIPWAELKKIEDERLIVACDSEELRTTKWHEERFRTGGSIWDIVDKRAMDWRQGLVPEDNGENLATVAALSPVDTGVSVDVQGFKKAGEGEGEDREKAG